MKIIFRFLLLFVLALGIAAQASFAAPEKYGAEISNRQLTAIKDILANPKAYAGKTVTIEGKIASECPSGCWFFVKVSDGNANIYVDIGKAGFAIPQYTGKKVLVEGTVEIKNSGLMIKGKGVEVQ